MRLVFPLHFFRALAAPMCFITDQSVVKASSFVNSSLCYD